MKNLTMFMILVLVLVISGCADNSNIEIICEESCHTYGFWGGFLHGAIAPFDFIGSLIWDDVTVWAQNNNGAWYSFGFLWGVGAFFGSSVTTANKGRK